MIELIVLKRNVDALVVSNKMLTDMVFSQKIVIDNLQNTLGTMNLRMLELERYILEQKVKMHGHRSTVEVA